MGGGGEVVPTKVHGNLYIRGHGYYWVVQEVSDKLVVLFIVGIPQDTSKNSGIWRNRNSLNS